MSVKHIFYILWAGVNLKVHQYLHLHKNKLKSQIIHTNIFNNQKEANMHTHTHTHTQKQGKKLTNNF